MTKKFSSSVQPPIKIPLSQGKPPPPFKHANKTTPDRFASNASSVVGIAFGAGMVALVASVLTVWGLYSINVPVKIGASGLCAGPVMLFVLLAGLILVFKNRDLVTTIETIIGHDLNQDGWVGAPQSTEIVLPHSNRGGWERWTFPFSQELLRDWGLAALEGQTMLSNLYLIPHLLGREQAELDIWHSTNYEQKDFLEYVPSEIWALWDTPALRWAGETDDSPELRRVHARFIEVHEQGQT